MTDRAFHPDLQRLARVLPSTALRPMLLRPMRAVTGLMARLPAKDVEARTIGAISVRLYQEGPDQQGRAALLWIHGGGYVMGRASIDDAVCRHFARALGIVVASVEYRLAPEHPFPQPLHDCYDALTWLARQSQVDPARIAIGGASAGGGLAAAVALLARDRGEIVPALQLLSYPMLDDRTAIRTDLDQRRVRMWNNTSNRFGWESYLGLPAGSPEVSPLAAPARHGDLSGLPPAWIGVGTVDLFYDEDVAYAARLRDAGVPCDLEVVPGAFHGFDSVAPKAGVTRHFRAAQVAALAAALD